MIKEFAVDFAVLVAGLVVLLWVQEAFPGSITPEKMAEARAARRANEVMFESCRNTCLSQCLREPK